MSKIRINELARELEVKPGRILEALPELGVQDKKTHSSSLDDDLVILIRRHFGFDVPDGPPRPRPIQELLPLEPEDDAPAPAAAEPTPPPTAAPMVMRAGAGSVFEPPVAHSAPSTPAPAVVVNPPVVQPVTPPLAARPLTPPIARPDSARPSGPSFPVPVTPPVSAGSVSDETKPIPKPVQPLRPPLAVSRPSSPVPSIPIPASRPAPRVIKSKSSSPAESPSTRRTGPTPLRPRRRWSRRSSIAASPCVAHIPAFTCTTTAPTKLRR